MGYRYGEHKYGEGLYSRWPDWWHEEDCQNDKWAPEACKPASWAPETRPPPVWVNPPGQLETWAVTGSDAASWTPASPGSARPNTPRAWKRLGGGYRG